MKLQSEANHTTTNDDDLNKEVNGDPLEKDQEQPTADEPEIANDEVLEETLEDKVDKVDNLNSEANHDSVEQVQEQPTADEHEKVTNEVLEDEVPENKLEEYNSEANSDQVQVQQVPDDPMEKSINVQPIDNESDNLWSSMNTLLEAARNPDVQNGADVSSIAQKIQSEASNVHKCTNSTDHVKDSTPEQIIEVPMPGGTNETIIINPDAFNAKESSFEKSASEANVSADVLGDKESIVNGSRDDNSAQESKLTSGKSFLTDSSNRSLIDDSLEDHSFIPPGNQTAAESSSSGKKKFLKLKSGALVFI